MCTEAASAVNTELFELLAVTYETSQIRRPWIYETPIQYLALIHDDYKLGKGPKWLLRTIWLYAEDASNANSDLSSLSKDLLTSFQVRTTALPESCSNLLSGTYLSHGS